LEPEGQVMRVSTTCPGVFGRAAFFVLMASGGGCCGHAYLNAVTSYTTTAVEGVKSLNTLPEIAASSCRKRAAATYLAQRFEGTEGRPFWEDYYLAPKQADGALSWSDYCADVKASGKNFQALLAILVTYANAMKTLAAQGAWDGSSLATLTGNLSTLVGASTPLGDSLSAMGGPAKQLGAVIVASYTESRTQAFAAAADSSVQAILKGLGDYIDAVDRDVVTPEKQKRLEVLKTLEGPKMNTWKQPLDPTAGLAVFRYATEFDADSARLTARFATDKTLITKLAAGHAALAKAQQSEASASTVAAAVADMVAALTQAAGSGPESNN
jgi:hypothetical protein